MNRKAIYQTTGGIGSSAPLSVGELSRGEERDRLVSSYSAQHGVKVVKGVPRRVKASSRGLLAGSTEEAEDLTGQRAPGDSSR